MDRWRDQTIAVIDECHKLFLDRQQLGDLSALGGRSATAPGRAGASSPDEVADGSNAMNAGLPKSPAARRCGCRTPRFWNDVGPAAIDWVERDPSRIGIMADGGVNFTLERAALRRMPVGDEDLTAFRRRLHHAILVSQHDRFRTVIGTS
jgi:hypothetical protein